MIGAAQRVSLALGVGFLEKVYENSLMLELRKSGLCVDQQQPIHVHYEGRVVGDYIPDILVESEIVVEIKAVPAIDPIHRQQCINYLRATDLRICLLLNFGRPRLEVSAIIVWQILTISRSSASHRRSSAIPRTFAAMSTLTALRADPRLKWAGVALIAIALLALPFALAMAGTAWVRITNLAILFVLLSLGLNIVVGFAGLLDLGYIAFYAVGAYVYALLASPHFGLHLPWWAILPIGAAVACTFGVILGTPTLKLRGDYLAIVTLGFGEIIRIFLNNLSEPFNLTNGPKGIATIDPIRFLGVDFSADTTHRRPRR